MRMTSSSERMEDLVENSTCDSRNRSILTKESLSTDKVDANSQEGYESCHCEIHPIAKNSPFPDGLMANKFQNGIVASKFIPAGTRFGPYEGKKIRAENIGSSVDTSSMWKIKVGGKLVYYIDGNGKFGNWMRYMKYASNESEENLVAFQLNGQIYYRSYKDIDVGEELFVARDDDAVFNKVVSNNSENTSLRCNGNDRDIVCSNVSYDINGSEELAARKNNGNISTSSFLHKDKDLSSCSSSNPSFDDECKSDSQVCDVFGEEPFICDIYDYKSFICDLCGNGFTTSSQLNIHLHTHIGKIPYKCGFCAKRFTQSGSLKEHLRIHTGERPYKCGFCGKGFSRSGCLKEHLRTHTGERPYKCDVCGKGFTQRGNLKSHTLLHTGEKPYKCGLCCKGYTQRGNLKRHLRTHTGEKPFKCSICEREFSENGSLKKHIRTHTEVKPYKKRK